MQKSTKSKANVKSLKSPFSKSAEIERPAARKAADPAGARAGDRHGRDMNI